MSRLELSLRKHFPPPAVSSAVAQEVSDEPRGGHPQDGHLHDQGFQLDVSLRCETGITVLFGASGAGKTLTLDSLAGFCRPDEGRIVLDDAILFDAASGLCLPTQRRKVGYVFQNYALFPHLSIEQNLAFGVQHLPAVERGRRIHEQLTRFGIASKLKRLPRELSGGEKQRASIARALICEPRLLLLDEPVRGLDYPLRADFYDILRRVRAENQIPILLVTHDAEEAYLLADQVAVIEAGRVVQVAKPDEIFERPASPSVARLLGIGNIFAGAIESLDPMSGVTRVRAEGLALSLPYLPGRLRGDLLEFCIHKNRVRLHRANEAASGSDNVYTASIVEEVFSPRMVKLVLALELSPQKGGTCAPVTLETELSRQAYQSLQLGKGDSCRVEVPPGAVHVFSSAATPAKHVDKPVH